MIPSSSEATPDLDLVERYLARVGLAGVAEPSLTELHRAHVRSIPYENLDVVLGREIRLDVPSLAGKLVDAGRGGYCYEQNTLLAAVLEALDVAVTRCLGRVRLGDATTPRPATHMVLVVDGVVLDAGFGSATPLGPVPLGGEATHGSWTWRTERTTTPEGEDAWQMALSDLVLYTFTDEPRHAVDYIAPNHYSSTHPRSVFTAAPIVQRSDDDAQISLVGLGLTERRPDGTDDVTIVAPTELGDVLRGRFGLVLDDDEVAGVLAAVPPPG